MFERLKRITPVLQLGLDSLSWGIAIPIAIWARLNFVAELVPSVRWLRFSVMAIGTQAIVGLLFGLYRRRWRYATFEEAGAAARAVVVTTLLLYGINRYFLVSRYVPYSVPILAGFGALVAVGSYRYCYRLLGDLRRRPSATGDDVHRALVFGAGEGGTRLLTSTLRDKSSALVPVALLDDDPNKCRLLIRGVRVVGTRHDIAKAAWQFGADTLVIAIPSAGGDLIAQITDLGREAGLTVKVLPSISELIRGATLGEIRDVTCEDLLGRHTITTDVESVAGYLRGRRVMVTGAGGSIGAELCRQVHTFRPAQLLMVDRDESALHAVQMSLEGRALLDSPNLILADIRDHETVIRIFEQHRPEVVFHAAALKHLPLLQRFPAEAVKSNIWGTLGVLRAAAAVGVTNFVNISTDKAAAPVSVLGYSKRIAERLTAHFGETAATGVYLSVRFGNVLGSRGSMLGTFTSQIAAGGPVTVTDPDVTRYFMTVQESVQLVVQAGGIGQSGEVLILDMGRPVRIADVARRLIAESGRGVQIVYTGLRPGEKLHEELFGLGEADERRAHPMISHTPVPPLDPDEVVSLRPSDMDQAQLIVELSQLASLAGRRRERPKLALADLREPESDDAEPTIDLSDSTEPGRIIPRGWTGS
jgi:FlaA1/EpsC-like NDP-sugar epimerase